MVISKQTSPYDYDVVIIGGGPSGTTVASLVRKYNPALRVLILEKEKFPRDHVGESQLPGCSMVLHEMGAWDKVEAQNFPVKIGASYTWGRDNDSWEFDFFPVDQYEDRPRPDKYQGQRLSTAFQVDRAVYDEILLRHSEELGAEVREQTRVNEVMHEDGRVTGLKLSDGSTVTAKHYVDASGHHSIIRRSLGVPVWTPKALQNIAVWNYYQNEKWGEKIGVGATRVQVRSIPWGWMWFIPLGPTRTSVGLVTPAEHYKSTGKTPEQLYHDSLPVDPTLRELMVGAVAEGPVQSTKDWSFLSDYITGPNWFLVGEAVGFADPVLAAGMNIAHNSAKDLACTILEIERGEVEADWLKQRYNDRTRLNVKQHIQFAEFWYAANGCFTDLREHCQNIAKESGLSLSPQEAWAWLSQGGFVTELPGHAELGSFDLGLTKSLIELFGEDGKPLDFEIDKNNVFDLDLEGAVAVRQGYPEKGRIRIARGFQRGDKTLLVHNFFLLAFTALMQSKDLDKIMQHMRATLSASGVKPDQMNAFFHQGMMALEAMIAEGWVKASLDRTKPTLQRRSTGTVLLSSKEWQPHADARTKTVAGGKGMS
ncbi:MAG: tryptophan 7-halogenase [Phycisphaeraceae bacterium]|nr:tryptophan 7-halogenase [Phycisphaerales bacterium]MCB9844048.1 tryptophan 7-halogenase [Phycisphaeraceae bacterium]